jgi:hypothetical protein
VLIERSRRSVTQSALHMNAIQTMKTAMPTIEPLDDELEPSTLAT